MVQVTEHVDVQALLLRERIALALDEGNAWVEAPFLHKNGSSTPYMFTGRRVLYEGRICVVGMGIDISERVRAHEALKRSEERVRGTLKDGEQRIVAIRIEDPDLVKELEEHGVMTTGEITSDWWSSLLWLVPLVLLMLFWNVTLTRAGQTQGAASFVEVYGPHGDREAELRASYVRREGRQGAAAKPSPCPWCSCRGPCHRAPCPP